MFLWYLMINEDTSIDSNKFPKGKDFSGQTAWLFRRTNMYLYAVVYDCYFGSIGFRCLVCIFIW